MNLYKLDDMIGGWFIGHFEPSVLKTTDFEVAIKKYKAGDFESKHFHKVATEYTVIVSGSAKMDGVIYGENSIIKIEPGIPTDFLAITDVVTVVVKKPSIQNDKYLL